MRQQFIIIGIGLLFLSAQLPLSTANGFWDPVFDVAPTEKPPLPSGALIRDLNEKESWRILFQYGGDDTASAAGGKDLSPEEKAREAERKIRPASAKVERLAPYTMIDVSKGLSVLNTQYYTNNFDFYQDKPNRLPTRIGEPQPGPPGGGPPAFIDQIYFALKKNKFVGFEWIQPNHYLGVMTIGGTQCMVFEKDDNKAWIDLKKRTPVFWKQEEEIRKFIINPPPTSLPIPANVLEEMRRKQERRQRLDTVPVFPR